MGGDGASGPHQRRTLVIGAVHERLPLDERKVQILDLGAACGETLRFYSDSPCKIYFADLFADLQDMVIDPEEGAEGFAAACKEMLAFDDSPRFDLIQTWDLFNYLSPEEISALTSYLRDYLADTGLLVALIWNTQRIPTQANRYAILDKETVEYRPRSRNDRPGPRYKEPDLLKVMQGYRAGRSFLLRHGAQEYAFEAGTVGGGGRGSSGSG